MQILRQTRAEDWRINEMIRVFPRKTEATPTDELAFLTGPPLYEIEGHEVCVSCTFSFDKKRAEALADQWRTQGYKVSVGGPAYQDRGGEFIPGRFVLQGMVITSRGCNNDCDFCSVPSREGPLRELEIKDGWNLLDNNILQCSEKHVRGVFEMLDRQDRRNKHGKKLGVKLTGGLEAAILKDWHVDLLASLKRKPEIIYFAYDEPADLDPLVEAAHKMRQIGFNNQTVGCYVLMGWKDDTIEQAKQRLQRVVDLDMMPYGMLFAGAKRNLDPKWRDLQRNHTRPSITRKIYDNNFGKTLDKQQRSVII